MYLVEMTMTDAFYNIFDYIERAMLPLHSGIFDEATKQTH